MRRNKMLQQFLQLKPDVGGRKAARAVRTSWVSLWRWQRTFAARGVDGLRPKYHNCGSRSFVAGVSFSAEAIRELERLVMEKGRVRGWLEFSQGPLCPAAVAQRGYKGMPAPVARLVKLKPLPARCKVFASADGQRLFLKIKISGRTK